MSSFVHAGSEDMHKLDLIKHEMDARSTQKAYEQNDKLMDSLSQGLEKNLDILNKKAKENMPQSIKDDVQKLTEAVQGGKKDDG